MVPCVSPRVLTYCCLRNRNSRCAMRFCASRICVALRLALDKGCVCGSREGKPIVRKKG